MQQPAKLYISKPTALRGPSSFGEEEEGHTMAHVTFCHSFHPLSQPNQRSLSRIQWTISHTHPHQTLVLLSSVGWEFLQWGVGKAVSSGHPEYELMAVTSSHCPSSSFAALTQDWAHVVRRISEAAFVCSKLELPAGSQEATDQRFALPHALGVSPGTIKS